MGRSELIFRIFNYMVDILSITQFLSCFVPAIIDQPSGSSSNPWISGSGVSTGDSVYNPKKRKKKTKGKKKKRLIGKKKSKFEKLPKKSKKNPK